MDSFIRSLREGRAQSDKVAPLILLRDSLATVGGQLAFRKSLVDLWAHVCTGRSQGSRIAVVCTDAAALPYASLAAHKQGVRAVPIDHIRCNPGMPLGEPQDAQACTSSSGSAQLESVLTAFRSQLGDANPSSAILVIDSLSQLVFTEGIVKVVALLQQLVRHAAVSTVYAAVHEDVLDLQELCVLESMSSCQARLQPVEGIVRDAVKAQLGIVPDGEVAVSFKKRMTGRVRVEKVMYHLHSPTAWSTFKPPEDLRPGDAQALLRPSEPLPASQGSGKEVAGGGMRLEVSEEEKAARDRVVLPYQHQGQATVYQNTDFKDYLPVAAGGRGGERGKLGHVMYVRDSDNEYDSDEDPDDDLDI